MNEEIQSKPKAAEAPVAAASAATQAPASAEAKAPVQGVTKSLKKPAPARKATAKPGNKTAAVEAPPETVKPAKERKHAPAKPKLVRDSFTLPENDYMLFATLKKRALAGGMDVKKSEVLRAALAMLARTDDAEFLKAVSLVERIKTGRPKK